MQYNTTRGLVHNYQYKLGGSFQIHAAKEGHLTCGISRDNPSLICIQILFKLNERVDNHPRKYAHRLIWNRMYHFVKTDYL